MNLHGCSVVRVVCGRNRTAAAMLLVAWMVSPAAYAQQAAPPAPKPVQVNRAARDAWSPIMDVLKPSRTAVTVTEAELQRLRELPLEAGWGALQNRNVVVVELGGMVDRATFLGDVTGLGMKAAGAQGVIVDGGIRDLSEFFVMKDLPIYYRGAHASAMADQVGVEWNGPIRLGGITVLPGDIIVADAEGVLAVPPQLVAGVIKDAENTVYTENFKREMMRSKKYRARDIYPTLSPALEKLFEEWKKTHPLAGVKPNVGGMD